MSMNDLRDPKGEGGKRGGDVPPAAPFLSNMLTVLLVFLLLVSIYSFISERKQKPENLPLSQLALDIQNGTIATIAVEGTELHIEYTDGTKRESKKELESSLSESLKNYGVVPEALAAVKVEIKGPSGFGYWFLSLAPILLPILFLVVLMWYLSRQVKGSGGMQAFTFGQSKARIIYPDDTAQRVTFKDIAGA
ncbi:MAG TPA: hypothetical protein VLB83_05675, partial [Candidatus Paceibacterota bacterium]|nr:hypothetical protein [Candidatus Paceibacterota bacterium]